MRRLEVRSAENSQIVIEQEILRSNDSRYDHRLHGVLMVSRGMGCAEVARWLGQNTTTIERWVKRFNAGACRALREGEHTGQIGRAHV